MPPEERITALLAQLRADLATLRRYGATVPLEALRTDQDKLNMVMFGVYRSVQTAIDLGQRIVVDRQLGAAESYSEVVAILGTNGIISQELAIRLRGWTGLRNVIAHVYRQVDVEILHRALTSEVDDLVGFADAIASLPPG